MRPASIGAASFRRRRAGFVCSIPDRWQSTSASPARSAAPAISTRQIRRPARRVTRTSQSPVPPYSAVTGNSAQTRPARAQGRFPFKIGTQPQLAPAMQLVRLRLMLPCQRMSGRNVNSHPCLHRQTGRANIGRVAVARFRQANLRPLLCSRSITSSSSPIRHSNSVCGKRWSNWLIICSSTAGLSVSERTKVKRASVCAVKDTASSSRRALAASIDWT